MAGSFDDCYLCHWHMSGPWKKISGGQGQEIWCGAGRPEFTTGQKCPTRIPYIEIEFNLEDHPRIVVHDSGFECELRPEAQDWIAANQPRTKIEIAYEDCLVLRFDSKEDAVLFKMFMT